MAEIWFSCFCRACAPRQTGEEPETSLTVVGISQVGSESGFRV